MGAMGLRFEDVLKKRRSIRKFRDTDVPDDKIRDILELANLAPSAGNRQAFKVAIVRDQKLTNVESPVTLVICADPEESAAKYGERGRTLYALQDATIFAAYLQLVIVEKGLASVWIGAFREGKIKRQLGLGEELRPIAIIPLGYPAVEKSGKRRRKSLDRIIV